MLFTAVKKISHPKRKTKIKGVWENYATRSFCTNIIILIKTTRIRRTWHVALTIWWETGNNF